MAPARAVLGLVAAGFFCAGPVFADAVRINEAPLSLTSQEAAYILNIAGGERYSLRNGYLADMAAGGRLLDSREVLGLVRQRSQAALGLLRRWSADGRELPEDAVREAKHLLRARVWVFSDRPGDLRFLESVAGNKLGGREGLLKRPDFIGGAAPAAGPVDDVVGNAVDLRDTAFVRSSPGLSVMTSSMLTGAVPGSRDGEVILHQALMRRVRIAEKLDTRESVERAGILQGAMQEMLKDPSTHARARVLAGQGPFVRLGFEKIPGTRVRSVRGRNALVGTAIARKHVFGGDQVSVNEAYLELGRGRPALERELGGMLSRHLLPPEPR